MKFWELFFKSKKKEQSTREVSEESSPDLTGYPDLIAELDLGEHQYILNEVSVNLCQDLMSQGDEEESKQCYEGVINITMRQEADRMCVDWCAAPNRLHDGALHFYSVRNSLKLGMLYSIAFTDARCVILEGGREEKAPTPLTRLCISPRSILIGSEEWKNKWK